MDKNKINLSLKALTRKNNERIESLNYESIYTGFIISLNRTNYVVLIKGSWVIGKLETDYKYKLGEKVEVRPIAKSEELILTAN